MTELKEGICKDCLLNENEKVPFCNYHQGMEEGRKQALEEVESWIEHHMITLGINNYYKDRNKILYEVIEEIKKQLGENK